MNCYGLPHCTYLLAAIHSRPNQGRHQTTIIIVNVLSSAGFRLKSKFQNLNKDLYHLKLLLREL